MLIINLNIQNLDYVIISVILIGYRIYIIIKKILNLIYSNYISILLLCSVIATLIFPDILKYINDELYIFYIFFVIFYIIFKLLLVQSNQYNRDIEYDDRFGEKFIKYEEKYEFNGLTKDDVDLKKKNIRKNLKKEKLI